MANTTYGYVRVSTKDQNEARQMIAMREFGIDENRHFWAEGYYVSTVGLNEATIKKYIQDQEKHDIALDKLSVREYEDPFKGDGK